MMNRVVLVGRITKDIELKYTPSGVAVATFTLAVNRTFTDQQGERQADFINCVVWRKPAENAAKYLKKGSLTGIDGRLQTRKYDGQDGKTVYVTEVVADSIQFLQPKGSGGYQPSDGDAPPERSSYNGNSGNNNPYEDNGQIDISDDDLPF